MKNPVSSLARRVGIQNVRRTLIAATLTFLVAASGLTVLTVEPFSPERSSGLRSGAYAVQVADDQDADGLPDAMENLVGSDPDRFDTLGDGVADGYLHHHFTSEVDWTDPGLLARPVLRPPTEELPEPLQRPGAVTLPTVAQLYSFDTTRHEASGVLGAWWLQGGSIDPHEWDNAGDGIADAWLIQHGLDPLGVDAEDPAPGDDGMTLREKYLHGLDPTTRDTDGDGLLDAEELDGEARIGDLDLPFEPTDPLRASTRGDGITDGFLVRFGLDPHDPDIGAKSPAGDGLTVAEAFLFTQDHCVEADDGACVWRQRLEEGPLLDPTVWDSNGDGVPDIWSLRDPHGIAHPFEDMRERVIASTEEWDAEPWSGDPGDLSGVVVDDANPAPEAPYTVNVADAYAYLRPHDWDEEEDGPWWDGLPTVVEAPEGGLPTAVALRGWNVTIDRGLGGVPDLQVVRAHSDPRRADTSGDGLLDLHEYFGVTPDEGEVARTNPADPDTDGDDLPDASELVIGTDPLKRDSSGSFLADGFEHDYWTGRLQDAATRFQQDPTAARDEYAWLNPDGNPQLRLDQLGPLGDLSGDGVPNILSASADGDGLKDGAELFPNRFLDLPSGQVRPVTDPARVDTDGDGLPDAWEVSWSLDRYYNCGAECRSPVSGATGWPLDPSLLKSIDVPGRDSDFDINLAADTIPLPGGGTREFTSGRAYTYDLHPYRDDSSGDGLSDMFTIEYGVEAVPGPVADLLHAGTAPSWVEAATARVNERLEQIDRDSVQVAVLDPAQVHDGAPGPGGDLLSIFDGREKGTWVYQAQCPPSMGDDHAEVLPGTGLRREAYGNAEWSGADDIPSRAGLEAGSGCWNWIPHALADDQELGTDPWRHGSGTSSGEGLLPDAWRSAYGISPTEDPGSITSGSVVAGCDDESLHDGLPDPSEIPGKLAQQTYCLTLLETYLLGLDPRSDDTDPRPGDTDGGGMSDWLEVALELDPLDKDDDDPDGDWDGDGLTNLEETLLGTNPLTPDTDRDGLADGGTLPGQAGVHPHFHEDGDLCLHKEGGQIVPGTEKRRPAHLTRAQMYDMYVEAGILHVEGDDNLCPSGMVRFLAEGRIDPDTNLVLGAGAGSDPTRLDSSGDGLPDGWVVYWRTHGQSDLQNRFDPTVSGGIAGDDPDDGVGSFAIFSNLEEYRVGRPADWDEQRDGPWWGGTDPTRRDTTGTRDWFEPRTSGEDLDDRDADGDGLTGHADPYPLEHGNKGQAVQWSDEEGRYVTDYTKLWNAIASATRTTNQFIDSDEDGVPDWLDRAKVQVLGLSADGTLVKRGATAQVTGRVVLDESHVDGLEVRNPGSASAGNGVGVVGATVRLVATDSNGDSALVGAGFTGDDGWFTITAAADASVQVPPVPAGGAVLAGRVWDAGDTPSLLTALDGGPSALGLLPGPLRIHAVVDPNDPDLQPLDFDGHSQARAYKPVSSDNPYLLPDGRAVRAVVVNDDGDGPEPHYGVSHITGAIFGAESENVIAGLSATTEVILDDIPARVVQGLDDLVVGGRFVNVEGVGLGGRTVEPSVAGSDLDPIVVDSNGVFSFPLDPTAFPVGILEISVTGTLLTSDQFLTAPEDTVAQIAIARETHWEEVMLDEELLTGTRPHVEPGVEFRIDAKLTDDNLGTPVPDRPVQVHLLRGLDPVPVSTHDATTDDDGWVSVVVDAIDPSVQPTLHHIRLREVPEGTSEHRDHMFTIEPRYATTLVLADLRVPVGEEGFLVGELTGPHGPVESDDALFIATSDQGVTVTHTGTEPDGVVRIPLSSGAPVIHAWNVSFAGTTLYAPSEPVHASSTHHIGTQIEIQTEPGLRSQEVPVSGRLVDDLGRPVKSVDVEVGWSDGSPATIRVDDEGRFEAALPPRSELGAAEMTVHYPGTDLFDPSEKRAEVPIHLPTSFGLEAPDVQLAPGDHERVVGRAVLKDEQGDPLPGRTINVDVSAYPIGCRGPSTGACRPHATLDVERTTGADGAIALTAEELPVDRPVRLHLVASYTGTSTEAPADGIADLAVTHRIRIEVDRLSERSLQGETVTVEGRLQTALPDMDHGPLRFNMEIAGEPSHEVFLHDGSTFRIGYPIPQRAPVGEQTFTVTARASEGIEVVGWQGGLFIGQGIELRLHESLDDDGRKVHIKAHGAHSNQADLEAEVVVLRRDAATNRILDIHRVPLDPTTGEAVLDLGDRQEGELSVVSLRSPTLEALETSYSIDATTVRVAPDRDGRPWLAPLLITTAAVAAAGTAASYLAWKASGRMRLQQAFVDAHRALLDPSLSPADVVRRAYKQLLSILESAGYTPPAEQTVRDIADNTIKAFRVKPQPMRNVSKLFEVVVYSDQTVAEAGRRQALHDFFRLARDLGAPERSLRGGSA